MFSELRYLDVIFDAEDIWSTSVLMWPIVSGKFFIMSIHGSAGDNFSKLCAYLRFGQTDSFHCPLLMFSEA